MTDSKGQLALVIGAGKGIGRGIAELFLERGLGVVAVDIDEASLDWVDERENAKKAVLDMSHPDVGKKAQAVLGDTVPQVVCIAAGIYPAAEYKDMSDELWSKVLDTNLNGPVRVLAKLLPGMEEAGYGRVVLVTSITGPVVSHPSMVHYSASKSGLEGAMRALALAVAQSGVTINAIRPGNILTDGVLAVSDEDDLSFMRKGIPMRRLGDVNEVAELAYYLCLPNAGYVTGQTVVIDGGQVLQEYQEGLLD